MPGCGFNSARGQVFQNPEPDTIAMLWPKQHKQRTKRRAHHDAYRLAVPEIRVAANNGREGSQEGQSYEETRCIAPRCSRPVREP